MYMLINILQVLICEYTANFQEYRGLSTEYIHAECDLKRHLTHCNTLQHTTTHCNIVKHTATRYHGHAACDSTFYLTKCNTLQNISTHVQVSLILDVVRQCIVFDNLQSLLEVTFTFLVFVILYCFVLFCFVWSNFMCTVMIYVYVYI